MSAHKADMLLALPNVRSWG